MSSSKQRKRSRRSFQSKFDFQRLEPRRLLAGFHLDVDSGDFTVIGDGEDNTGQVRLVNGNLLRGSIDNQFQDVDISQVARVVFVGFGGDDRFTNNTSIPSAIFGHDGDDVLNGGTGNDTINGGNGIDQIFGDNGDDLLIGAAGRDVILGWQGNDRIFGGGGLNELRGHGGDDEIFGGNDDDVIFGGDGIDKIYGLDGDDVIDSGAGGIPNTAGVEFADLVMGLNGDDTIIGGGELDVFWGGNGDDTLIGGRGENRLHGQAGNDQLTGGVFRDYLAGHAGDDTIRGENGPDYIFGGAGKDTLYGGSGNDHINGGSEDDNLFGEGGDDFLTGGIGDDAVDGGLGSDTAIYSRNYSNYRVTGEVFDLSVHDKSGFDGTNLVKTMEVLRFADGEKSARPSANEIVRVQPIITANDDGSNRAEFMGNSTQTQDIQLQIADIFAQADVDILWLAPRSWNNTFANIGDDARRPESDLNQIVLNGDNVGVGNSGPLVLDLYFVEKVPGFRDGGENTVNGLAFIDANGIAAHVGDNLVGYSNGREVVARTLAHEIAHNLGLRHVNDESNLMDEGTLLTAGQAQIILDSRFSRS